MVKSDKITASKPKKDKSEEKTSKNAKSAPDSPKSKKDSRLTTSAKSKKGLEKYKLTKKRRAALLKSKMNNVKAFAAAAREKFGKYIKSVIVMGSFARGDFKVTSDIDTLVIIDDTVSNEPVDEAMRRKLSGQLQELGSKADKEIHIQLHLITEFWEFIREGDAIFFNYLRNGSVVFDAGFFRPMQRLLRAGLIKPSREAIFKGLDGATGYVNRIEQYYEFALERMYRAVTWSANAFLMAAGMPPAEPPEIAHVLNFFFVKKGKMDKALVDGFEDVRAAFKAQEHKEIKITPDMLVKFDKETRDFVAYMKTETESMLGGKFEATELKDKIKSTPKIFWIYSDERRGYAWLFEDRIFVAVYGQKGLEAVLEAPIDKGKLGVFAACESNKLFSFLENNAFKPIITPNLINVILGKLPESLSGKIVRIGVEYPDRALLDLSAMMLAPQKAGKSHKDEVAKPKGKRVEKAKKPSKASESKVKKK